MTGNDRSLMHDLMFKEVFADHHNRKQLIRLLEIVLDCKLDNVKDELKVTYESPLAKEKIDQKSVRGDVIIEYGDTTINLECYTLCEASHKVYYEKKKIMRSCDSNPRFFGIFLNFYFS